jgi:hypothetical protein
MANITNPTNRNTHARVVEYRNVKMYFSYASLIAVAGYVDGQYLRFRADNCWGPTTGRHINEMGLRDLPILDSNELHRLLDLMMLNATAQVADEMVNPPWRVAA